MRRANQWRCCTRLTIEVLVDDAAAQRPLTARDGARQAADEHVVVVAVQRLQARSLADRHEATVEDLTLLKQIVVLVLVRAQRFVERRDAAEAVLATAEDESRATQIHRAKGKSARELTMHGALSNPHPGSNPQP